MFKFEVLSNKKFNDLSTKVYIKIKLKLFKESAENIKNLKKFDDFEFLMYRK